MTPTQLLEQTDVRTVEEHTCTTHDGLDLFYRYWPAPGPVRKGAIVLFHRVHEHSGRMAHLVDELGLRDFAVFAWDARGHGRSPGQRGFSPSAGTLVRDVQTFIDHITWKHKILIEDVAVVAQSVGAVLVAAWAHDYAPPIRCMVLASPAFRVKLYAPFARTGLRVMQAVRGNFFVNSHVRSRFLTHDPERMKSYDADPLIARPVAVNVLLGLDETSKRVVSDARAITIPTQLLISGSDFVAREDPQHRFFERLGSPVKERHVFRDFFHDTFGEWGRKAAVDTARTFIQKNFDAPSRPVSLLEADRVGYTRDEADTLASPLSPMSLRGAYWRAMQQSIKLAGLLSDGIRLGRFTGFHSGSALDYVYENRPNGVGPLGRLVDQGYLQSIGSRGIRQRKSHLEEIIRLSMDSLVSRGMPVRVLDIAAGHGRYVLDAIQASGMTPQSVQLRDDCEENVAAGRILIAQKGLGGVATFTKGDAFDAPGLAAVDPQPTIGIVSGLYELFSDNSVVIRSLSGLARAIRPGGYLVYTCQPWHPQLELIARTLTSHRGGQPWVMRRRTQAEMDQLVAAAGFTKIEQRIDEWGMFTVSVAERIGR